MTTMLSQAEYERLNALTINGRKQDAKGNYYYVDPNDKDDEEGHSLLWFIDIFNVSEDCVGPWEPILSEATANDLLPVRVESKGKPGTYYSSIEVFQHGWSI